MPPSLRYQFVEVVREARPDPNAQSLTSPQPGEHLGNFDEQVWGELRERGHFRIEGYVHATRGPFRAPLSYWYCLLLRTAYYCRQPTTK